MVIGAVKLRELAAAAVDRALTTMAGSYSLAAVSMGHLALKRYPVCCRPRPSRPQRRRTVRHPARTTRKTQQIPHPRPGRRPPQGPCWYPDRRLHRAQPRHRDPHRGSTRPVLRRRRLRQPARHFPRSRRTSQSGDHYAQAATPRPSPQAAPCACPPSPPAPCASQDSGRARGFPRFESWPGLRSVLVTPRAGRTDGGLRGGRPERGKEA
jgi:hypothetical protein